MPMDSLIIIGFGGEIFGLRANVYAMIAQTGVFAAVANAFATKVLYNFPFLIGAGGFMIILALYAEPTKTQAVKAAKQLARNNKPSQVNIHYRSADSQLDPIQDVVSYGK